MREIAYALLSGHGVWLPAVVFVLLGSIIFALGSSLARAADIIAETTGLGRAWIGVVLLAASTSLPEITADVDAALMNVPDIGVGDLIGSTLANMLILAILDLVFARRRILQSVAVNQAVIGLLAIVLTLVAGVAIAAHGFATLGWIGIETPLIVVVYLVGMRFFSRLTRESEPRVQLELGEDGRTRRRRGVRTFALATAALAVIAPALVVCADTVSSESGLSKTFVGTMLMGITTSFPEIAAAVAAVRIGAVDLAVGNIFGSSAFNMCVLLLMDLAYRRGPLLANVSSMHLLTTQLAVMCLALGVMAILGKLEKRTGVARFESVLIVASYVTGMWLLH